MKERLQKILARAGYGSRRSCEQLLVNGRVRVNGEPAGLGDSADSKIDNITLDGRKISILVRNSYVALYKPRGVISAVTSYDGRTVVADLVPVNEKLYPVGRLDVDSEGLILLTNDGDLANRLTHPRFEHEKEYRVLVARFPDQRQMDTWRKGLILEDGFRTQPADLFIERKFGKGAWLRVIMKEGHKRQIREMGKTIGLPVVRIIRVRIGTLQLGNLKPGQWRSLTDIEVSSLKELVNRKSSKVRSS